MKLLGLTLQTQERPTSRAFRPISLPPPVQPRALSPLPGTSNGSRTRSLSNAAVASTSAIRQRSSTGNIVTYLSIKLIELSFPFQVNTGLRMTGPRQKSSKRR